MKQKSTQLQLLRQMASKLSFKVKMISKVIHQLLIEMKNHLDSSGFICQSKQTMEKSSLRLLVICTLLIAGIMMGSSAFAQRNITVGTTTSGGSWSGNTFVASADDATVAASEIESRLNGGNTVTINTSGSGSQHGNIHVTSTITKTSGGTATLILLADYRINIMAGISSSSGQLNFEATAGRIVTDRGRIGQFRIWSTGSISTNGGNVTIEGVNNSVTGGTHWWSGRSWGCAGNPDCRGVQLNGSINAGGGHMSIVALRHSGGTTQGVRIEAATVQTSGNGNVYISGQGNGVSLGTVLNDNQVVRAQNGSITIIGDAATTGNGIGLHSGSIVETTGTGNVILTSTKGDISGASTTLKAGGTTTITAGTSSIDLSNSSNDLTGTVSVSSGANVTLANGKAMTLGSVSVSGTIDIYTTTGNLTLNGNVSTSNTTVNAIRLNAGRNTSQPTTTGGNIIRSSGNVTTGSGGTAVLYTGSLAGSTGITGLSGYNSSNVYYCTDRNTTLSPTPGSGLYVAYRECAPSNPTGITATHTSICNGGSTQLTATGAVGTVYWYTGSCGGTQIGTGNPITVSPSGTTTYFARNFNNGQFSTGCASISINVSVQPTAPGLTKVPTDATVCESQMLTVTISAGSGGTGTIADEYSYSTNNGTDWSSWSTSVPNFAAVTGTNIIQSRRTADGAGCNESSYNQVSWSVYQVFTAGEIASIGETICYNTAATLEIGNATAASGGDDNITYSWEWSTDGFSSSTTIDGATAATYTPGTLTQTTTFRRYAKDGTCIADPVESTGEWTVTVHDQLTLSCPEDFDINTDHGVCTASLTFAATAGGTPTPDVTYKVGDLVITSPHNFPTGATTVVATAVNSCGLLTCSFTVTVTDNQYPTIENLPENIAQSNDEGDCGAVVTWTEPT